ncbi:MAG TPA: VUT family protein [Kiloniellales bacterium]
MKESYEGMMGVWVDSLRLRGFWIGVIAMIVIVTGANIAVQYPINDWLTWGAFTYPVSFLVTDLTNRNMGPAVARRVVYVGFVLGVALSFYFAGWRIAIASGSAFLVAQLLDVQIFDRLRRGIWWRAPFVSSTLASVIDTALFFGLAFAGTGLPWVTWAIGDYGVKLAMALGLLIPFRALMPSVRSLERAGG